jgi:hypothetical protein
LGVHPIGMDIDTFKKQINYLFQDHSSSGHNIYIDLSDYYLNGLDLGRDVIGNLQVTVVEEQGVITRIYMRFSEYELAP